MGTPIKDLEPNTWYWFAGPEDGESFIPVYSDSRCNVFVNDESILKKHLEIGVLFQAIMPY